MGRHVSVILGIAALAVATVGCTWRPLPARGLTGIDASADVLALDPDAYDTVALRAKQITRTPDGRLRVELDIANIDPAWRTVTVQVQTRFLDAAGVYSGDETPMEMVVLSPDSTVHYECASLTPAASYVVHIKTPY